MTFRSRSLAALVRLHRALLVASTVGVSIFASRLATSISDTPAWLGAAASGLVLGMADYMRDLDEGARDLQQSSGVGYGVAVRDLSSRRARIVWSTLTLALVLFVGALVVRLVFPPPV